jgi:hypothetical protein
MAGLIRLYNGDFLAVRHVELNIPRGTYDRFVIALSGTNQAVGAANGNLGNHNIRIWNAQIQEDGNVVSSFENAMMFAANQRWFGAPYWISADNAAFSMGWRVPASPDPVRMPNSFYSRAKGHVKLVIDASADVSLANAATCNLEVFAVPSDVTPKFMPLYRQTLETTLTANGIVPLQEYAIQNPREIFLYPLVAGAGRYVTPINNAIAAAGYRISNGITNIQITKDGKLFHNGSLLATLIDGHMEDKLELGETMIAPDGTATPGIVHIHTYNSAHLEGALGGSLQLELTCGATQNDALIMYVGVDYLGAKSEEGRSFADSNIQAQLSKRSIAEQVKFAVSLGVAKGLSQMQIQESLKKAGLENAS